MRDYKSSNTFKDMCATIDTFKHFEEKHSSQLEELAKLYSNKYFVVVGTGSSLEFPGMNAYQLFPNLTTYPVQANEVPLELHKRIVRFLVSNSGRTTEVLMHADVDCNNPTIIITSPHYWHKENGRNVTDVYEKKGEPDNWHIVTLITSKEGVNAATGSVMEQAAIIQSIYDCDDISKKVFPNNIAEVIDKTLTTDIGKHAKSLITKAFEHYEHGKNKLYITGSDKSCVAKEAIIKAYEIIGRNIIPSNSLSMLHGQESTVQKGDVLFITFPSLWPFGHFDLKSLTERVEGKGGHVVYIDIYRDLDKNSIVPNPTDGMLVATENYLHLAMVWKALLEIGAHLGIDPDKNKGTLKIGNEEKCKREYKPMTYIYQEATV